MSIPKIQKGDSAPLFTAKSQNGQMWSLSESLAKGWVLLIFYPGDDTAVCTKQLCDYRDHWQDLNKFQVTIVGISTDSADSHNAFSKKYRFPFLLLDDSNKEICRLYSMLSILGMAQRGMVLIAPSGDIAWIHREVIALFRREAAEIEDVLKQHVPLKAE